MRISVISPVGVICSMLDIIMVLLYTMGILLQYYQYYNQMTRLRLEVNEIINYASLSHLSTFTPQQSIYQLIQWLKSRT